MDGTSEIIFDSILGTAYDNKLTYIYPGIKPLQFVLDFKQLCTSKHNKFGLSLFRQFIINGAIVAFDTYV